MSILEHPHSQTPVEPAAALKERQANQVQSARMITLIIGILSALASLGLLLLLFTSFSTQVAVLAALYAVSAGFCFFSLRKLYRRGVTYAGLGGISLFFGVAILATAGLLSGLGFPVAVIYLIFALIVSSITQKDWQANLSIAIGIFFAGLSALASDYSPFEQVYVNLIGILTPAIMGVLFMIYVTMQAMQFVTSTLRIRLVTTFLAIVIIPLAILSVIQSRFMFNELSRETSQTQLQASQQVASGVDEFIANRQNIILEAARLDNFARYLMLPKEERAGSPQEQEMRIALRILDTNEENNTIYLSSYALLDSDGINVYDTFQDRIASRFSAEAIKSMGIDLNTLLPGQGSDESANIYFQVPARSKVPYISQVEILNSTRGFFYMSAPIKDDKGHVWGVLRARYDAQLLQDLLKQYNGLIGYNSYAILLDDNNIRLADQVTPNMVYKALAPLPADQARDLQIAKRLPNLPADMLWSNYTEFNQFVNDYERKPVFVTSFSIMYRDTNHSEIGAVTRLRAMPWKLVYLKTDYSDEALRREQRRLTTLVTVLIAGLVGLVAVGAAQLLSNPIIQLTRTAQSISTGNLNARAVAHSSDEFGMLGAAFNLMTNQLRTFINELEERVKARTQEIENQNVVLTERAAQLQTVSDVARQIVSAQDLESLLSSICRLVSDRFGFYHVGIFLVDEKNEYAVLRAANSDGGQRMLARHHMLPVGKVGIVGYATGTGEARITTDVGEDAVYFNNPDLPETRSEMALPLKVNNQVIGALDIQSKVSNAFHREDIELFNILADQVAIAIHNNTLYLETLEALEESRNLHRQYLRSEWAEDTAHRKTLGYLFNQAGIVPQQAENPLWKKVFSSGEPVYAVLPSSNGTPDKSVMAVPIAVRGETIGVIHVQDQGQDRLWSEDDIAVVNSIASQVAVALENARLFENTVRRAEREKKVLQITARIRSTNDPEEMMQIALGELQQALGASRSQIYIRQEDAGSDKQSSDSGRGSSRP